MPRDTASLIAKIDKMLPRPKAADLDSDDDLVGMDETAKIRLAYELGCWKTGQRLIEWWQASEAERAKRGEA